MKRNVRNVAQGILENRTSWIWGELRTAQWQWCEGFALGRCNVSLQSNSFGTSHDVWWKWAFLLFSLLFSFCFRVQVSHVQYFFFSLTTYCLLLTQTTCITLQWTLKSLFSRENTVSGAMDAGKLGKTGSHGGYGLRYSWIYDNVWLEKNSQPNGLNGWRQNLRVHLFKAQSNAVSSLILVPLFSWSSYISASLEALGIPWSSCRDHDQRPDASSHAKKSSAYKISPSTVVHVVPVTDT